jgi:hypothetical protein
MHGTRVRKTSNTLALAGVALAVAAAMSTACSGDDDSASGTRLPGATTGTEPAVTAAAGTGSECPTEAVVSSVLGTGMIVDPNPAATASFFCPYTSADGSGDLTVSVTFAPMDLTQDPGAGPADTVEGVGQRASWSAIGELTVWTGTESIVVVVDAFGSDQSIDPRTASVDLARAIIGG